MRDTVLYGIQPLVWADSTGRVAHERGAARSVRVTCRDFWGAHWLCATQLSDAWSVTLLSLINELFIATHT